MEIINSLVNRQGNLVVVEDNITSYHITVHEGANRLSERMAHGQARVVAVKLLGDNWFDYVSKGGSIGRSGLRYVFIYPKGRS